MRWRAVVAGTALMATLGSCSDSTTDTGTDPGGSGKFSGGLAAADLSGIIHPVQPVAGATLSFFAQSTAVGTSTSAADGSWTSPSLAGGTTYTIHVTAPGKKDFPIIVPLVPTPRNIGEFGMVAGSTTPPATTLNLQLSGSGLRANGSSLLMTTAGTVEIYDGVYLAASDSTLVSRTASFASLPTTLNFDGQPGHLAKLTVWGPVTVRVVIPGLTIPDQVVYFDTPTATLTTSITTPGTNAVATLDLSPSVFVGNVGATVQLVPTPRDANRKALAGRTVTYASSNPAAATVSATGLVTIIAYGIADTITATSEGISATMLAFGAHPAAVRTTVPLTPSSGSQYFYADATTQSLYLNTTLTGSSGTTIKVYSGFPTGTPLCSVTVITSQATCSIPGPVSGRYVIVIGPAPNGGSLLVVDNSD